MFLTSISMMFGFPSRESLSVAALESSIKLQEISNTLMEVLSLRNSARDSQNIWPKALDERDRLSRLELLLSKSMQSFDPALSSSLFNDRERCFRILFTLSAYAKYLDPS